ncbi:adenylosuccinate synthetase, partial [Patescibacteria group bacterium]|nr:adenylosuccinate synthetase [Patescibacteria group bacterium]
YTTRVGEGPFPTELNDDTGKKMQEVGNEFGSTTGRGRRCGWFDGVAAKYSCMINGVDSINLTKIDVLNDFSTIKICEQYEINGEKTSEFKSNIAELQAAEPKYQELPGWQKDLENSSIEALPENCKKYIERIEEITGTKVDFIGTGPDRSQMIVV